MNGNCIKKEKKDCADSRKEQLIIAALKVFCDKGYADSTVDDITQKANCSHGLFYHYFNSKRELLDAVLTKNNEERFSELRKKTDGIEDYCQKLNLILSEIFSRIETDELFSYYFYFVISHKFVIEKSAACVKKKNEKRPIEYFTEFFEEGQKKGYFNNVYSPHDCAVIITSVIAGATLGYAIAPKDLIKSANIPSANTLTDMFRKRSEQ